ncbi:MAG: hypothetical protein SOS24_05960 [Clostridia bacterium]|nr:hypothetical protein [Clostridia bacterium]
MKKKSVIALICAGILASQSAAFAMSTRDFDKGMAKGISYFNRGLYYEAKDEFTWFKDYNYSKMNSGQQKYLDDYLNGTYRRIEQWESKQINNIKQNIIGWWFFHYEDMDHLSENIQFGADGSFYSQTWRTKCYGTYEIDQQYGTIYATYDIYYCWAGQSTYEYGETGASVFSLNGNTLECIEHYYSDGKKYTDGTKYVHKDSFTDVGIQN